MNGVPWLNLYYTIPTSFLRNPQVQEWRISCPMTTEQIMCQWLSSSHFISFHVDTVNTKLNWILSFSGNFCWKFTDAQFNLFWIIKCFKKRFHYNWKWLISCQIFKINCAEGVRMNNYSGTTGLDKWLIVFPGLHACRKNKITRTQFHSIHLVRVRIRLQQMRERIRKLYVLVKKCTRNVMNLSVSVLEFIF